MIRRSVVRTGALAAVLTLSLAIASGSAVRVHHREGLVHGFLVLKSPGGAPIANGDLIQTTAGDRVTSVLRFRFHDGSLYDETTVYSERGEFRLIGDHLVEKGPSFPQAIDLSIDGTTGAVTVRYDDHGRQKSETERLDPVPDLANGMILTLLKNVGPAPPTGLVMIVATPTPRQVSLTITRAGEEPFETEGLKRRAIHFVIKATVGGVTGVMARLLGKQPPDSHVWILDGEAPAFVKSRQPLYAGGPLWQIELVSARWPGERP
jgi:hypothetical protein